MNRKENKANGLRISFLAVLLVISLAVGKLVAQDKSRNNSLPRPDRLHQEISSQHYVTRLHESLTLLQEQLRQQNHRIQQLERALQQPTNLQPWVNPPNDLTRLPAVSRVSHNGGWLKHNQKIAASDPTSKTLIAAKPEFPAFQIGGQYRVIFNAANFDFHDATISDNQPSQSFFNQRFRTWLTVRTSEHVEGYLQTEIGHVGFGDDLEFPKAFIGPRFPAGIGPDRVGIEMRYGYLTYTSDTAGQWRAGIQDWQDTFDQTLASSDWDFGVGGLSWFTTIPALRDMRLFAGAFVLFEGDVRQADDVILWTLDGDWGDDAANSIGWSVYFVSDRGGYSYPTVAPYDSSWDIWFGIRARLQTVFGPVHGFFIYNRGKRNEFGGLLDFEHNGFAIKLATASQRFWFGQLRFQTLYSTGDDDPNDRTSREFRTIAQSVRDNFGAQGYWSYLAITSPHVPSDVNDLGVSLQNRGLGLFTAQIAFDYGIHECLSATFAVGWLNSDQPNPTSGSRDMGTELLNMFTYDFGGGLKADVGTAVLFTGDFYKTAPIAPDPDTLWEVFSRVQLDF